MCTHHPRSYDGRRCSCAMCSTSIRRVSLEYNRHDRQLPRVPPLRLPFSTPLPPLPYRPNIIHPSPCRPRHNLHNTRLRITRPLREHSNHLARRERVRGFIEQARLAAVSQPVSCASGGIPVVRHRTGRAPRAVPSRSGLLPIHLSRCKTPTPTIYHWIQVKQKQTEIERHSCLD